MPAIPEKDAHATPVVPATVDAEMTGGGAFWALAPWLAATAGAGMLAASPGAVGFWENFFPNASGRPFLTAASLTGAFWLLALPWGWFPGAAGEGWRAAAGKLAHALWLAWTGLALGLAVAARVEPFPVFWAAAAAAALGAQLFAAWAVARRAPRLYAPLFGGLSFLLPFLGWLGGQFAAMLALPVPAAAALSSHGSYFSCLAALTMSAPAPAAAWQNCGRVAVFVILHLALGGAVLAVCRPQRQS
ncbi:MAG: hypothetical protein J6333_06630 [Planctomycetes bacterium]|nr:hypothetical protein [Planctomycetota bacterium]